VNRRIDYRVRGLPWPGNRLVKTVVGNDTHEIREDAEESGAESFRLLMLFLLVSCLLHWIVAGTLNLSAPATTEPFKTPMRMSVRISPPQTPTQSSAVVVESGSARESAESVPDAARPERLKRSPADNEAPLAGGKQRSRSGEKKMTEPPKPADKEPDVRTVQGGLIHRIIQSQQRVSTEFADPERHDIFDPRLRDKLKTAKYDRRVTVQDTGVDSHNDRPQELSRGDGMVRMRIGDSCWQIPDPMLGRDELAPRVAMKELNCPEAKREPLFGAR